MIYSIFQFGDTLCREIMVPRIDMLALDVNSSLPEAIQALTRSGHSRVPVYEDTIDNIVGCCMPRICCGDAGRDRDPENASANLLRPAYFVPEAKKVDELLREMQSTRRAHGDGGG